MRRRTGAWSRPIVFAGVVLGVTLGTLVVLRGLAEPLILLFIAVVSAQALAPFVTRLERWMPRIAAIILIYSVLLSLVVGFCLFVVPPLVTETQKATSDLPRLLSQLGTLISRVAPGQGNRISTAIQPAVAQIADRLAGSPMTALSALGNAVQVTFLSLFWLVSMPSMKRFSLSLVPASRHEQVKGVLEELSRTMGGYVRVSSSTRSSSG